MNLDLQIILLQLEIRKKTARLILFTERMERMKDHTQVYGGAEEEPDYKTLVKQETNLAVLSSIFFQKKRISQIFQKNRMYLRHR